MMSEKKRLQENIERKKHWKRWGPYLSERQWGVVREDYSENQDAWNFLTFKKSHSQVYRWGEDGIGGICDNHQRLCFSFCFWNGKDPFIKEKLFGLSNMEGNHGEDVKEMYYYLDNTPTHSYMKYLYKYPQMEFPYQRLLDENKKRGFDDREFELMDTGAFKEDAYFDIFIEYAKQDAEDLFISVTIHNRGNASASIHLLPTLTFRNTWKWDSKDVKPNMKKTYDSIEVTHETLGNFVFCGESPDEILFTENETNEKVICNRDDFVGYSKDAFSRYVVDGEKNAINPSCEGTKAAFHYELNINGKSSKQLFFRLEKKEKGSKTSSNNLEKDGKKLLLKRRKETDKFFESYLPKQCQTEYHKIAKQAFSGMLWNKQFYHYVVERWLAGEENTCPHMPKREEIRNFDWQHLYNDDVLSVPDKWEYPAFYSWDTAFHTLPLAVLDPEFAKRQLILLTREWYMHPSGQIPAYEWNFDDVNPPVHAWALWRIYKIEKKVHGISDTLFLERVYQKLIMNFTWWVNREDSEGRNIFKGGFLGLDNISVFNRSENLPEGTSLFQSDATSWMGMYCLNMLTISLELAKENIAYEDMASKFYEHFLHISGAINFEGSLSESLWNEEDGFYYDMIQTSEGKFPIKVRSLVGLIPLFAVMTIDPTIFDQLKGFKRRMDWFLTNRKDLCGRVSCMKTPGVNGRRILAFLSREKLTKILAIMLDEEEFLSPSGIRSLSKKYEDNPYAIHLNGNEHSINYEPAESTSSLFGGNSNWRGPVWFPINMLIIESLQKFHHYYGDEFQIECPTGSGNMMNLWDVSIELSKRLVSIYKEDASGNKKVFGSDKKMQNDPHFKDYLHFHEYFHGNTGEGLGASHQTGWSGLIAKLVRQLAQFEK